VKKLPTFAAASYNKGSQVMIIHYRELKSICVCNYYFKLWVVSYQ